MPLARQSRRFPTSNSLPSGHSASAAAFAVGVGLENPPVGLGLALLAGLVGLSRVAVGAHYPGDVFAGFGIGAGVAVLGARIVPPVVVTKIPAADPLRVETPPRPDGAGVVLVINPASGSGTGARVVDEVRDALPAAEVVEVGEDDDIEAVLRDAAKRAEVLAVGGGDGTVSCAAGIAVESGRSLAVFPGGTFNHFAKDIGCDSVAKTVDAIRRGSVACVDLVCLNEEHIVVNTASIGAYPTFVRTREKLEHKIGKPLAGLYAMFHTLRRDEPVRIAYDNKTLQTSLFFLGNSTYLPSGFAPSRRTRMDDGLIDVRILETGRRFSTLRIVASLALGRLERSPLYHEMRVPEFAFTAVDGSTVVAHDGEVGTEVHGGQLQRELPGAAGVSSAAVIGATGGTSSSAHDEPHVTQRPSGEHVGRVVHVEHDPAHPDRDHDDRADGDQPTRSGRRTTGSTTVSKASTPTITPSACPDGNDVDGACTSASGGRGRLAAALAASVIEPAELDARSRGTSRRARCAAPTQRRSPPGRAAGKRSVPAPCRTHSRTIDPAGMRRHRKRAGHRAWTCR